MSSQVVCRARVGHLTSLGLSISSSVKWEDGFVCAAPAFQERGGCIAVLLSSNLKRGDGLHSYVSLAAGTP